MSCINSLSLKDILLKYHPVFIHEYNVPKSPLDLSFPELVLFYRLPGMSSYNLKTVLLYSLNLKGMVAGQPEIIPIKKIWQSLGFSDIV
jgi:hypothetical protein